MKKKAVCILTSNHIETGISDQLDFLTAALNGYGIEVSTQSSLNVAVPNILIENFTNYEVEEIKKFKSEHLNIDLFCVLTEHFELKNNTLFLNDEQYDANRTYLPNLYDRFTNLIRLSPLFSGLIVLNNMPKKESIEEILPQHRTFSLTGLPQPLEAKEISSKISKPEYDLCFFGFVTEHRKLIIDKLKTRFRVYADFGISSKERNEIIMNSKFNVNIAQSEHWSRISPMRVFSSSKLGVWTINLSTLSDHHLPGVIDMPVDDLMNNGLPNKKMINNLIKEQNLKKGARQIYLDGFDLWVN